MNCPLTSGFGIWDPNILNIKMNCVLKIRGCISISDDNRILPQDRISDGKTSWNEILLFTERPLVPSAIVGRLSCFVSSASLDCFRPVLAVTLNRCLFSSSSQPKFFFLAAFGSTFLCGQFSHSRKRRSLSCPVSLERFRAPCFRLVPRRFSLCSVVSTARPAALLSRRTLNRFSSSSLDSWDSLAKTRLRSPFNRSCLSAALSCTRLSRSIFLRLRNATLASLHSSCNVLWSSSRDIFSWNNVHKDEFNRKNWRQFPPLVRDVAATFWRAFYHVGRYTHITRQSSALHAPLLLTRPPTPSSRYTHITRQSSALHAPLLLTRPPLQVADIPT